MEKSERFGLALSPDEKAALVQLVEAHGGLSLAATVRCLIREAALERSLWSPESMCGGAPKDAEVLNNQVI